ncbi:hypothetical protein AAFF_G00440330 [Aldrovandia affinis]|uniref:Uncharacterized protein n=1 Tax=Aldrovandia affinis TaxID=143900 RepID=A0AAD7WIF5_9TELE|nr:hypothetical protein AAFF_G00440330 [Aldrovandia affinis]
MAEGSDACQRVCFYTTPTPTDPPQIGTSAVLCERMRPNTMPCPGQTKGGVAMDATTATNDSDCDTEEAELRECSARW